jgi:hypothetical protein
MSERPDRDGLDIVGHHEVARSSSAFTPAGFINASVPRGLSPTHTADRN